MWLCVAQKDSKLAGENGLTLSLNNAIHQSFIYLTYINSNHPSAQYCNCPMVCLQQSAAQRAHSSGQLALLHANKENIPGNTWNEYVAKHEAQLSREWAQGDQYWQLSWHH